jgi:hypothetical protein
MPGLNRMRKLFGVVSDVIDTIPQGPVVKTKPFVETRWPDPAGETLFTQRNKRGIFVMPDSVFYRCAIISNDDMDVFLDRKSVV